MWSQSVYGCNGDNVMWGVKQEQPEEEMAGFH